MISRISQILDRIQEIRSRFHMDASALPSAASQTNFSQQLAKETERIAPPGKTLTPYAVQPTAPSGFTLPPLPGIPQLDLRPKMPTLPPAVKSQALPELPFIPDTARDAIQQNNKTSLKPPPLPSLPFDPGMEPYLSSLNPRPPGSPGVPSIFKNLNNSRFSGQDLTGFGLQNAASDPLRALVPATQQATDPQGMKSLLDLYRNAGSWEQALNAYNSIPGPGLKPTGGLPFP